MIDHAEQLRAFADRLKRGEPPRMILEVRGLSAAADEIERQRAVIESHERYRLSRLGGIGSPA